MTSLKNNLEFKFERSIAASPEEAFNAWMSPETPGTIWNAAEKFIVDPKVDGLFFWTLKGTSHYGMFTEFKRGAKIRHTWVSPNTLGIESTVTVTFEKRGEETLMTLVHSKLPDDERARNHENGWNYFLNIFLEQFGNGSKKPYRFEEAHPSDRKNRNE
jgi:uncharacterized protein YndB with AHSA1/START domain